MPLATAALWSRRVHTLERIADMVCSEGPGENQGGGKLTLHQAAYAPFSSDPKRRHLFRQYRNVRGKTLLQSKDRLALTASIVSNAYVAFLAFHEKLSLVGTCLPFPFPSHLT